jgi:hypothetical protein
VGCWHYGLSLPLCAAVLAVWTVWTYKQTVGENEVIKVLGKLFSLDERALNEGESPYFFGYPIDGEKDPEDSPYYWWWQYLRRHEGYVAYCQHPGGGEYSDLYADWGDIRDDDFGEWFYWHGDKIFREPSVPDRLIEVRSVAELDGLDWQSVMVVVNPIQIGSKLLSKRDIKRQFSLMVDARFAERKPGRPVYKSAAKYRIVGYPKLKALKEMLHVYDLRKAEPDLTLWEIGERLYREGKISIGRAAVTDPAKPASFGIDARNVMTATISRHLRTASTYIQNSTGFLFPIK